MASSATFNTRIQTKIDTKANWDAATDFIPLKGEMCIYSDIKMIKVGDGITLISELPFSLAPSPCSLTIGTVVYDGSENKSVPVYDGM